MLSRFGAGHEGSLTSDDAPLRQRQCDQR